MGLEPGEVVAGRYKVTRMLGKGGAAAVYLATDLAQDSPVAVKALEGHYAYDPRLRERFVAEARLMQRLNHPNVVRVHDLIETGRKAGDAFYIVMEYMAGGSMEDLLRRQPQLSISRCVEMAIGMASGLASAHREGVVHRDIKPSNILLDAGCDVAKIGDFGIAHIPATGLTTAGQPGTLLWLSPEQALNKEVDERSDLYSLGVVLYQMLTGGHYYLDLDGYFRKSKSSDPMKSVSHAIVHEPALRPSHFRPEITSDLDEVLMKALAKRPRDRYLHSTDLLASLEAVLAAQRRADVAPPTTRPETRPLPPASLPLRLGSGIVDLALVAVLAGLFSLGTALLLETVAGPEYHPYLLLLGLAPAFSYLPLLWAWRARTLGMMAFGLSLVDEMGNRPRVSLSVARYLVYLLYVLTLGVGFLAIPFGRSRRGLYDIVTGISSVSRNKVRSP
jgi:eukaryotic-like serine/threonine-protein kinase